MFAILFATALLLAVTAPVMAQETAADSTTPQVQGYAPAGPAEAASPRSEPATTNALNIAERVALPRRSQADLEQALGAAQGELQRADTRLSRASRQRARTQALAQERSSELREIEARIRQADKEKRRADKASLEAERRRWERQEPVLQRLGSLSKTEFEAGRTAHHLAIAKQQALGLELQLAQRRSESQAGTPQASSAVIRELEHQTLEAQRTYRRLEHQLAQQEEDLANQRLDLYKVQPPSGS